MAAWALQGLKVAILIASGFEQSEMVGPKQALEKAGATVHIVAPTEEPVQGWDWMVGVPKDFFPVDVALSQADPELYDALLLPGGLISPDDLRLDERAVAFVKGFAHKPIAAICHGPWMLINADLVKGKRLTSWPSIKVDLINAGGSWVDAEVVRDGLLLTSRMPEDIPAFNQAMVQLFYSASSARLAQTRPQAKS
jgi:protease I